MEIKSELERIYGPIKEDLRMVDKRLYDLVPADLDPISTVEKYILDNGGKRLRPALILLSLRAVRPAIAWDTDAKNDQPSDALILGRAVAFAAAAELIHTATLVHDDLLDGSMLRRGHGTINYKWGNEIAVLLGDHMYLKATEILTSESILNPEELEDFRRVYRASNLMLQTASKIFKGEVLQHRKRGKLATSEDDYFSIIEGKSASFISACCTIGALLDGDNCPGADQWLASYGLNLGMAFQIRDDILDLMGDEKRIGKATGSDLKEGRMTLPVIHLIANAGNGEREYVESVLGSSSKKKNSLFRRWLRNSHGGNHNGFDKKHLQRIRKLMLDNGSIKYSMNVASDFAQAAKQDLKEIPDSNAKQSLLHLADHVMLRQN